MISAIRNGLLGYQPKWLAPRLAEATTVFQAQRFDWQIAPEEVRLVKSVLSSLRGVITHFLRPQAPVIVPTPAYMPFLTIPKALGHPVIEVPSLHGKAAGERGWMLDLEGIRAGLEAGAGLMILCNPWNPVGHVFSVEELTELHELLAQYEVLVFSDEIHSPSRPRGCSLRVICEPWRGLRGAYRDRDGGLQGVEYRGSALRAADLA